MRIRKFLAAVALTVPALAPGTAAACTLSLNNGGTMAMSMDGNTLGSEVAGGTNAALVVASLLSATVEVGAPTLIETPGDYDGSQDIVAIKYSGLGGLGGVLQDYTDQATSFTVSLLPLSVLSLDARILNPRSFAAGTYRLRTVVTCY